METSKDVIQRRLELLETGEPLAVCLVGLTDEDANIVRVAAVMHNTEVPAPDATAVATQRTAIMAAAATLTTRPAPATSAPFSQQLRVLWASLFARRQLAAGLAFLLLLALVATWVGRQRTNNEPLLTASLTEGARPTAATASETDGRTSTELPLVETTSEPAVSPTSEGAMVAALPPNQLFVPIISLPLLTGPEQAALHDMHGFVEIMAANGQWTMVTTNTHIPAGARIRTGAYSTAHIAFFDGSQARLGPNTELTLDQVNAQRPQDGFRTVVMTQWAGVSHHQVQFRHDGGSRYEVKTATGSGLARGTQFEVNTAADGRARYTVTEGKVDVTNNNRTVAVIAGQTTSFHASEPPADPEFIVTGTGIVTQIGDTWIIAGQPFTVNAATLILGEPAVGDLVSVAGHLVAAGDPVADRIQRLAEDHENAFTLTGPVGSIGDSAWIVAGQTISITADTAVGAGIVTGDIVRVTGLIQLPGSYLVATDIELVAMDDGLPFEFVGVVQTISDGAWAISGITVAVDEETEIDEGIEAGDTVKVEGVILEDDTWLAEEIQLMTEDDATFSFTGEVMSIDPWLVAGISFDVAAWANIEPGIEVGALVRVSGIILEDGTWLATEITRLQEGLLHIVFVGVVDNIEPWIVSGLPLTTDENTLIEGSIDVGDLVRVTVWIRSDGTWLATHIALLDAGVGEGCVAITAVITGLNGDEIIFSNGQTIILDIGIVIEGELQVGSVVLIVACVGEDGTITIVSITVIYTPPPPIPTPPPGTTPPGPGGNVTICHKPGTPAEQTKTIPQSALGGHLGHGDTMGPCP